MSALFPPGEWFPIESFVDAYEAKEIPFTDTVLLWNPCDGLHTHWMAHGIRDMRPLVRDRVFTHWQQQPEPPRNRANCAVQQSSLMPDREGDA